jgi:di/tricarboxylate transporter
VTLHQIEVVLIILGMLGLFVSGRLRYDLVGALALFVAVLTGVVSQAKAFTGFSNPVIIVIASVLVVSRAIAASNLLERWVGAVLARVRSPSLQIGILSAAVGGLSAFIKNVGTLGIFMPVAIQTARRSNMPRSAYLMPLAFASLIGGTITKIGTSPNLLISSVRHQIGGLPFGLFDFAAVGAPLTAIAVVFLAFGWRLLPHREGQKSPEETFSIDEYATELRVTAAAAAADLTVGSFETLGEGEITVAAIIREGGRRYIPREDWPIFADDVLVVLGDPTVVAKIVAASGVEIVGSKDIEAEEKTDEMEAAEVIVMPGSLLVGQTPGSLDLRHRFGVNLVAVRTAAGPSTARLRSHRFQAGDVVLLRGWGKQLAASIAELKVLPLADRQLTLGRRLSGWVPVALLALALLAVGMNMLDVESAFFGAAVLTVLLRQVSLKEAYDAIEWPVIVMLGCLIPVGEAVRDTGAAGLIAHGLTVVAQQLPGEAAVVLIVFTAMLLTPLMHHAAAVLVLGPVAAAVAANLHYRVEPFLMAVALGCACDFLTPIGHQNNTLVMAPGGYRFSDYFRLGLPLTLMVLAAGPALIVWRWPLH